MKEINLIVIDDEQGILSALTRLFRSEAFGVFTTSSFPEAMKVMEKEKIKVVMTDYRMPGITGTEILRKVKERKPEVMRILFTGYADMQVAQDAINKGEVYKFINKPWDDIELVSIVKEAIEKYDLIERSSLLSEELRIKNEALQKLNERLKDMYEAQKEFSSTVSHELRTPLASIKAMLEVLTSGTAGVLNVDQKNFLDKAVNNVERLNRLINEVLDLAKLESGKLSLNMKSVDMCKIVNEVMDVQSEVARKKGLEIKTEFSDPEIFLIMDSDRMIQVLHNLIGNAVKFTQAGGVIVRCTANKERNYVETIVKDTGIGISEEDISKLFNKFQQLGEVVERKGGTGLGLAICKQIIMMHGGKIWVEAKSGKGSEFHFVVPIQERRAETRV